jgi:hypothetical protein
MRNIFTKRQYIILKLALIITLFGSCSKKNNQGKIVDIEPEFTVQPWEQLDANGGTFGLAIATIANQNCGGTRIDGTSNKIGSKISVTIKKLLYPNTCNGNAEPARDTVVVGKLTKGKYVFNLNLKDVILNEGTLTVEDNKFSLAMEKTDGITVANKEIYRVPYGTIWGYMSYDNSQEAKATKFFNDLDKVSATISTPAGDYGYFNYSNSDLLIKGVYQTPKQVTKKILRRLSGTQDDLDTFIKEHRAQGIEVKIYTFEGKVL